MFQVGTQQRSEMAADRRASCISGSSRPSRMCQRRPARQDQEGRLPHRRLRPQAARFPKAPCRPISTGTCGSGQAPLVDYVHRRRAARTATREPLPLRIPLVVRILRRQDDRLGCAPRRYRPVGDRHGQHRPDQVEGYRRASGAVKDGWPTVDDRYNAATKFDVSASSRTASSCTFVQRQRERHQFEGDKGPIFRQPRRPARRQALSMPI